jgi:CRISPR/Cas system-associated protein Cas10 (large subunit of type III CRISPR-Cas system)
MEEMYNQLFVGGDLSGIQKFIYNISSKKAAVSLKGRSYYLQQYMENVCSKIEDAVNQAGAKNTEVIYNSGGKFYLLTDNGESIRTAIARCTKGVQENLWQEHQGQLGISISYVPFTENVDGNVNTGEKKNLKCGYLWKKVNTDFAHKKSQKFKDLLTENYQNFFDPIPVGGKPMVCAITGIESPDCVKMEALSEDGDGYVLPSVRQQIQLGEELRLQERFKTFGAYAGPTDLGILRMDVDGLGKRFIDGFNSIAEYKTFSKRLVNFFEEETKNIQQEPVFEPYLNIIYAGGDDLFVVGRWDKVIDFAERIHQETHNRFGSDGISISGGIAVVQPKFPISKAAELAGDAENAAKQFRNGEKNAFHMLGKTISWDKEFDYVKSFKQQFVSLIENYDLSKGILHKLMLYSSIADRNKVLRKEGKSEDFSYIWHISYYLTRYMKRYENNQTVCGFCRSLRDREIDYRNGRNLELIALAARWAELELKDNVNN